MDTTQSNSYMFKLLSESCVLHSYISACLSEETVCPPAPVCTNKLQARPRYTHRTCRYLWINHPALLIAGDGDDCPKCWITLGLPGPKTLHTHACPPFCFCFRPVYDFSARPTENNRSHQVQIRLLHKDQVEECNVCKQ